MPKIPINIKEGKLVEDTDLIIGIDLGTTNSLVAYMIDGTPIAVKGQDGKSSLVPSVIFFGENGEIIVGEKAREMAGLLPERTIYSVKRLMGKSYKDVSEQRKYFGYKIIDDDKERLVKIKVDNHFYTPTELSAYILTALKSRVEKVLNTSVSKAVITVPAYFNDAQRQATRDAGKLAGLDVLRIINEPTAASLAYGLNTGDVNQKKIAVYDLGGGTFDISILSLQNGVFEVLSTHGNTYLGGDDFDREIVRYWVNKYELDDQFNSDNQFAQRMRIIAENAKKSLTDKTEFWGSVNGYELSLDRKTFEDLIEPYIDRTIISCKRAMKDAGISNADLDNIVMVGGSTRTPFVKQKISQFFERTVFDNIDPDEVVALGASIQADVLAGKNKDILLLDVTPLSLGIETMGGLMDVIIPRNNKIPTSVGRQYTTSVDGQKNLKVAVYQGERDLVEHNRKLGAFVLSDIPPMPAGIPKIEVHFILDADGILVVKAKELRSGIEQSIEIRSQYGIDEEVMAKMLLESIQHAAEDMASRAVIEARTEAHNIALAGHKFLKQNDAIFQPEEKEKIEELLNKLQAAANWNNKDDINRVIDDFNEITKPFAERSMDRTISAALKGKKL